MDFELTRRRLMVAVGAATAANLSLSDAAAPSNPVQLENARAGASNWRITKYPAYFDWQSDTLGVDPYPEIEAYASASSVNIGETIRLYVNTPEPTYTLTVFRLGWYGGLGARQVLSPVTLAGRQQALPTPNALGTVDCNWIESYNITIPGIDWPSGVYLAKLIAGTSGAQAFVNFVVRDDARAADHLFQSSTNTAQAYNNWGGKSLYEWNSRNGLKAFAVSFNRPDADGVGSGEVLNWEVQMLRFLEAEGYDVAYTTNVDVHRDASQLLKHRSFLSVGHDEYWSYQQRAGVQAAQAAGVHVGFFSANTSYWAVRFSASDFGAANRTMTSYKEGAISDPYATDADPSNNKFITAQYRLFNSVFGLVDPVACPENAMIGVMYHGDPVNGDLVVYDATHWTFANAGVKNGDKLAGLLGYETDSMFSNGYAPAGLRKLCESPDNFGFSHATIFVAPSGSTTFAAGTMQWSWGLDDFPSWAPNFYPKGARVSPPVKQITRNLLNRFGLPALRAPTGVTATAGDRQLLLTWQPVQGATGYSVLRALTTGAEGTAPYRTVTTPSFIDTGLTNGTRYYYQVVATVGVAESQPSVEAVGTPVASGLTQQTISFPAIQGRQLGDPPFNVVATASSGLVVTFSSLTPAVCSVTTAGRVTVLAVGTGIIAANQAGSGTVAPAPQVTQSFAVSQGQQQAPAAPTHVTGYSCDVGCWTTSYGIHVNWTQSTSPGITQNVISRGLSKAGPYAIIATVPASTGYVDPKAGLVKGTSYFYTVAAVSANGTSAPSVDTMIPF